MKSRMGVTVLAAFGLFVLGWSGGSAPGGTGARAEAGQPSGTPPAPSRRRAPTPTAPAPGAKSPGEGGEEPASLKPVSEPGPYVIAESPRDWLFRVNVDIQSRQQVDVRSGQPSIDVFEFATLSMVFPMNFQSGNARVSGRLNNGEPDINMTGRLLLDDRELTDRWTLVPTRYHSGTRLAQWTATNGKGRELSLRIEYPVTTWRTKLDEARAMTVPWPTGRWPGDVESCLQPQLFVDHGPDPRNPGVSGPYDMKPLRDMVTGWLNAERIADPKSVPPARLAKIIAGKVVSEFQPSGDGLSFARTGALEGIALQPTPVTVRTKKGSEFDLCIVLAAAYRMVGLPARTMIGYDEGEGRDTKFLKKGDRARLRGWVEFCLYDEAGDGANSFVNWVPVDPVAMRRASSRPPPLDRPWRYFGTHDEMDRIIPFAYQFHPPTTVRAYGSPGFWGWMMTPSEPTTARQAIRFDVLAASKGPEDRRKKDDDSPARRY